MFHVPSTLSPSIAELHMCCAHGEHRLRKTFLENDHSNASVQGKTMKQVREGLDGMQSVWHTVLPTNKVKKEKKKLYTELFFA